MASREITCRDCNKPFDFPEKDQEFFKQNGWSDPVRCRPCRNLAKQRRDQKGGGRT